MSLCGRVENRTFIWILIWIFIRMSSVMSLVRIPEFNVSKCYVTEGHINIGIITQLYEEGTGSLYCGEKLENDQVLQSVEAVVWAVNMINNNNNPALLPNIRLGYIILDNCGETLTAIGQAMAFIPETNAPNDENSQVSRDTYCHAREEQFHVVGLLGLEDRDDAKMIADIMALFKIPVITTSAISNEMTHTSSAEHDYLFYLSPAVHLKGKAMINVLKHFEWTYSALLYSEGGDTELAAKYIEQQVEHEHICLAFVKKLSSLTEYGEVLQRLDELQRIDTARAVLLLLTEEHVRLFFQAILDKKLMNKYIWIGSETLTSWNGPEASGAFTIISQHNIPKSFSDYYKSRTPENNKNNPWMNEQWAFLHNCSWEATDGQSSCKQHTVPYLNQDISEETSKYIDGVYIFATALHQLITNMCPFAFQNTTNLSDCVSGEQLLPYIKNIAFLGQTGQLQFGPNGDILSGFLLQYYDSNQWTTIGKWDAVEEKIIISQQSYINWESYTGFRHGKTSPEEIPKSVCSLPCDIKEYKVEGPSPCCWSCHRCKNNEIIVGNSSCEKCPFGQWPDDATSLYCIAIDVTYLDWGDAQAVAFWFFSILGMMACIAIGIVYFLKRDNKLLKASNMELSGITLAGAFLTYMTMLVMLGKPNTGRCAMERFGFDNALAILVVPLMVRVNRSFRINQAYKKGNKNVVFIGRTSQLAFCIGVLLLQIILATLSMVVVPPEARRRVPYPETEKLVELHCHMPVTALILPLLFNLVMVLLCGNFGFSTFKLPDNFYESRSICIFACTTWILWLVFMPTYFSAKYQIHKTISLEVCLLFNASLVIFIYFLPKLYAVFYVKEEDLKLSVSIISTHPSNEISGLSERRPSGNHLQVGSPVASTLNCGDDTDENAILSAYMAKSGRRRSSTIRAIRKMDVNKIAAVQEIEKANSSTANT